MRKFGVIGQERGREDVLRNDFRSGLFLYFTIYLDSFRSGLFLFFTIYLDSFRSGLFLFFTI